MVDAGALRRLGEERIDWRFKGMPADAAGMTVAELAAERRNLFDGGFHPPLVVLDAAALEHNLATMRDWCERRGVLLAPHGKTTMAPQLFARQLEHGAWGITVANFAQLRVARAFGVRRVVVANQLVDPAGLRWVAGELARDPEFALYCFADSVRGVEIMAEALRGAPRPVDVLVELGAPDGRAGVRDVATAEEVARAVRGADGLRLAGVAGYEGAIAHGATPESLATVDRYLRDLRDLAGRLDLPDDAILSAGGSAYFDQVADVFDGARTVLRSGAYITHDDGFYRDVSPLRRAGDTPFRPALHAWAQVTSRPEPGLALLTLGRRDISFDQGLPEPHTVRHADGSRSPATGSRVTALNDQHAFLRLGSGTTVEVGDWVDCGASHPCTVFDKWQLLPVVAGDTVVDLVRTWF
ncbi:amino acid deaminase [Actinoallomurus iriomotensis]|uniref:Amino acid deaminase n=1 Tax=Actinoallomurus iriomotensis TaxID=478107 RepID=A0A9W6W5N4_9ACTN|nr:amino acid deaminase [Actinoallomurus iriomotensis]GLY91674.1 amino acid deaminase [Actinoallomurus iriomotensis]